MEIDKILSSLESMADENHIKDMKRVHIETSKAIGISIYKLLSFAKVVGKNHELALELWDTDIHEARHLACLVDIPSKVSESQLEQWVTDVDSWDLCDQCCSNLFDKTMFAYDKAFEWSIRNELFVKRAGFVLMACLSVHDKESGNDQFLPFFDRIFEESVDERNYVKKAVNWALRQIGKRNIELNKMALSTANRILKHDSKCSQWIARDAIRELSSEKIRKRLNKKR